MKFPSLKTAYLIWVLILAITTGYGLVTGTYQSHMSLAVDKAGDLPNGFTHQDMLFSFIAISLGVAVALILVAGVLVWKASKNIKWAIWVLTIFALWQAYDSVYTNVQLDQMYPGIIGLNDWLLGITCSLIWLYMIFAAHKLKSEPVVEILTP
jgi:hypothetical protein